MANGDNNRAQQAAWDALSQRNPLVTDYARAGDIADIKSNMFVFQPPAQGISDLVLDTNEAQRRMMEQLQGGFVTHGPSQVDALRRENEALTKQRDALLAERAPREALVTGLQADLAAARDGIARLTKLIAALSKPAQPPPVAAPAAKAFPARALARHHQDIGLRVR